VTETPLRDAPAWVGAAASVIRRLPRGRYRATNWVGRYQTDPFWARMPDDLGPLWFRCDLRDRMMREVCFTGRYEPQETALLQLLLRSGMTFVDVGANWGYFSLAAARMVGPAGRVVSVEADPRACRTLRANVTRNGLDAVAVLEMAASDGPGTLQLQEYEADASDSGSYGVAATTTVVEGGRAFTVAARALDDALDDAGVDRVDLLKMDIEGGEARALAGLRRRLAGRRIDRILLEVHPHHLRDQGSSAEAVVGELRAHGFNVYTIDHSPSAARRVGAGRLDVTAALAPLSDMTDLGPWPHLLCELDDARANAAVVMPHGHQPF
jgi:FkbM family methyltransferase